MGLPRMTCFAVDCEASAVAHIGCVTCCDGTSQSAESEAERNHNETADAYQLVAMASGLLFWFEVSASSCAWRPRTLFEMLLGSPDSALALRQPDSCVRSPGFRPRLRPIWRQLGHSSQKETCIVPFLPYFNGVGQQGEERARLMARAQIHAAFSRRLGDKRKETIFAALRD